MDDYVVGNVADLIAGNLTPSRPANIKRAKTPVKHQASPRVTPRSEALTGREALLSPTLLRKKAVAKKSPKRIFEREDLDKTAEEIKSPKADKVKKHLQVDLDITDEILSPKNGGRDDTLESSTASKLNKKKSKPSESIMKIDDLDITKENEYPSNVEQHNSHKKKKKRNKVAVPEIKENQFNKSEDKPNSYGDMYSSIKGKKIKKVNKNVDVTLTELDDNLCKNDISSQKKNKMLNNNVESTQSVQIFDSSTKESKKKKKQNKKLSMKKSIRNINQKDKADFGPESQKQIESETEQDKSNEHDDVHYPNKKNKITVNTDSVESKESVGISSNENKKKNKNKKDKNKKIAMKQPVKKIDDEDNTDSEHESDNEIESETEKELKQILDDGPIEGEDTSEDEKEQNKKTKPDKKKEKPKESDSSVIEDEAKRTLFVGNVPLSKKCKKEIKQIFNKYGTIESVRIRTVPVKDIRMQPKVAIIKNEIHPDRTSVNVYVKYTDQSSVIKALVENNRLMGEHHLRVTRSDASAVHDPRRTIFVGNIPFGIEDETLRAKFERCGQIESVRIIRDKTSQIGKGFGYVNFASSDGVELALTLTDEDLSIKNRIMRIRRYTQAAPGQKVKTRPQEKQGRGSKYQGDRRQGDQDNRSHSFHSNRGQGNQNNRNVSFHGNKGQGNRDNRSQDFRGNRGQSNQDNRNPGFHGNRSQGYQEREKSGGKPTDNAGALRRINKRKVLDNPASNPGPPEKRSRVDKPVKEKKSKKDFVGMTAEKKKNKKKFDKDRKRKQALSEILSKQG